jgi:hypothetical protein
MSEENLFEETDGPMTEDTLVKLQRYTEEFLMLTKDIKTASEAIASKSEDLQRLSREKIPGLLNSVGLSEIRLSRGAKLTVEDKIKASVNKSDVFMAHKEMIKAEKDPKEEKTAEEEGYSPAQEAVDSLFKKQIVILSDTEDLPEEFVNYMLDNDIPYDKVFSIHHSTLSKYVREKIESGKDVPGLIKVFQYQETKIEV